MLSVFWAGDDRMLLFDTAVLSHTELFWRSASPPWYWYVEFVYFLTSATPYFLAFALLRRKLLSSWMH